jgi:hypothetical protein
LTFAGILASLLLCGCASAPPASARIEVPGDAVFRNISVHAESAGGGVLVIDLDATIGDRKEIAARVRETAIGNETVNESRIIGYRDQEICEGNVCRIVKVPEYADVETFTAVLGRFEIQPPRLVLDSDLTASVTVTLRNPDKANQSFLLAVSLIVTDADGVGTLEIDVESADFLR